MPTETSLAQSDRVETESIDQVRFGVACEALQQTGLRELACIRVSVSDREMTLDGEVASYYLKQLATEAVRPHASGLVIKNRLCVPMPEQTR